MHHIRIDPRSIKSRAISTNLIHGEEEICNWETSLQRRHHHNGTEVEPVSSVNPLQENIFRYAIECLLVSLHT